MREREWVGLDLQWRSERERGGGRRGRSASACRGDDAASGDVSVVLAPRGAWWTDEGAAPNIEAVPISQDSILSASGSNRVRAKASDGPAGSRNSHLQSEEECFQ